MHEDNNRKTAIITREREDPERENSIKGRLTDHFKSKNHFFLFFLIMFLTFNLVDLQKKI